MIKNLQGSMSLLIQIVLYLLLAAAFISLSQVERQKFKKIPPVVGVNLCVLFLVGFVVIIFAFMNYTFESYLFGIFVAIGSLVFSFVFIKTFLDELKHTESKHWAIKRINSVITPSSNRLSFLVVLFISFAILLIILFSAIL